MTTETSSSGASIKTPLAQARGLGSAKDGVKHWWMQRLTSIPLVFLFFYFVGQMPRMATANRDIFIDWMQRPANGVAAILFVLCAFYHACLGMEEIITDYLPHPGAKIIAVVINKLFFFVLAVTSLYAIIRINFGTI